MDKIIIVDHVSKSFQGTTVLNDVSVSFERGKIHGIIGRKSKFIPSPAVLQRYSSGEFGSIMHWAKMFGTSH